MSTPQSKLQEVTKYPHATFSWVELSTFDAEDAKRFYSGVFGWSHHDMPMGNDMFYTMFTLHGKDVAGLHEGNEDVREKRMPPHWSSNITVNDIDATTAKVAEAGGTVLAEPFDVMEAGRMSVIQDPTGGVVALWEARQHVGASYVNIPGTLIWNELMTHDVDAAVDFYNKLLGWTTEVDTTSQPPYTMFKNGDRMAGGLFKITPEMGEMPTFWGIYFAVEDIAATVAKIKELGGGVMREPFDTNAGKIAVVHDPQGAVFQVIESTMADPPPVG